MVTGILASRAVEQQSYKTCIAILKLADKYSVERLEAASKRALSFSENPSLKSIQTILKSGQDRISQDENAIILNTESSKYGITRGADYYKGGND